MTREELNTYIDTNITNKTAVNSLTPTNEGDALKAVANYVDQNLETKENSENKSTDVNLGDSDELFPTQNAVKTYVDTNSGNSPKTYGLVEADNNSPYQELTFSLNSVSTSGASDKVVLQTTTEIGKEVLVFALNNGNSFTVRGNQVGTSVMSLNGISSQSGSITVDPNTSFRFIHLGNGFWKAESI